MKKYLFGILTLCLLVLTGCLPSIHKVVQVLSKAPIGMSRDDLERNLANVFKKDLLWGSPIEMAEVNINDDKALMIIRDQHEEFICVYPPDLYDKMPKKAFSDLVGLSESIRGGGSLRIIYDGNTNYIGFFAQSYK